MLQIQCNIIAHPPAFYHQLHTPSCLFWMLSCLTFQASARLFHSSSAAFPLPISLSPSKHTTFPFVSTIVNVGTPGGWYFAFTSVVGPPKGIASHGASSGKLPLNASALLSRLHTTTSKTFPSAFTSL